LEEVKREKMYSFSKKHGFLGKKLDKARGEF
jgi:hypothetical protein